MTESRELQELRKITNDKPAPMPEEADAPLCPACGSKFTAEMVCSNPCCETNQEDD